MGQPSPALPLPWDLSSSENANWKMDTICVNYLPKKRVEVDVFTFLTTATTIRSCCRTVMVFVVFLKNSSRVKCIFMFFRLRGKTNNSNNNVSNKKIHISAYTIQFGCREKFDRMHAEGGRGLLRWMWMSSKRCAILTTLSNNKMEILLVSETKNVNVMVIIIRGMGRHMNVQT